jgi:hypothetical protein
MIQTKWTRGNRRFSRRNVSAEYFVPSVASIAVAITLRPSAIAAALVNRSESGAIPRRGFSGLPGDTMSQT